MNNMLRNISFGTVLLLVAGTAVTAKEWRGIVPLKSTRQDVERLFGVAKEFSEGLAYYNLSNEIVVFHFKVGTCEGDRFGFTWNVPPGTVDGIGVIPKGVHRKEEYLSGSNVNVQDQGGGLIYYSDNAAGLTIETYKNVVTLVDYSPEASQDNLHCAKIDDCCFSFRSRFDEYEETSFSNEKARLDNLVINMTAMFARGVIEIIGPSKRDRQNQMKRAARGKSYLTKERGLEPERLLLIDGGFNETARTRLNIYTIGGLGARIFLYRRSDPDETAPRKPLRSKVGRTHEPQDRTLPCRYTNQYSIVEVANPKRKKDSDVVVPRDLNIVIGDKVLAKIELPTEAEVKNFSLNSIKKNKTGFELKVDWGGGLYHYAIQFNFKCKETGFYLYEVTKESFSTSNPASGKFLDKKESKVNKIEPNLPIERFSMTDYL